MITLGGLRFGENFGVNAGEEPHEEHAVLL